MIPATWRPLPAPVPSPRNQPLRKATALSLVSGAASTFGSGVVAATATTAAVAAGYQPLDSDLTSIAALSTTAYGRAFLTLADQSALVLAQESTGEARQTQRGAGLEEQVVSVIDDRRALRQARRHGGEGHEVVQVPDIHAARRVRDERAPRAQVGHVRPQPADAPADRGEAPEFNAVDASLWFVIAAATVGFVVIVLEDIGPGFQPVNAAVRPDHPQLGLGGIAQPKVQPADRPRDMPAARGDFVPFHNLAAPDLCP